MDQEVHLFCVIKKMQELNHQCIGFAAFSLLLIYPPTLSSDFQMGLLQQGMSYTKPKAVFKKKLFRRLLI